MVNFGMTQIHVKCVQIYFGIHVIAWVDLSKKKYIFTFLAPLCHRSGAFQMPTRPSASASSSSSSAAAAASTLRGGMANLRNASVTFSLFWHEASLG